MRVYRHCGEGGREQENPHVGAIGKIRQRQVVFPRQAPWLEDLEAELFAFPLSRFDDQVDSVSQALGHPIQAYGWSEKSVENLRKVAGRPNTGTRVSNSTSSIARGRLAIEHQHSRANQSKPA